MIYCRHLWFPLLCVIALFSVAVVVIASAPPFSSRDRVEQAPVMTQMQRDTIMLDMLNQHTKAVYGLTKQMHELRIETGKLRAELKGR